MPAGVGAPWLAERVEVGDMGICTSPPGSGGARHGWNTTWILCGCGGLCLGAGTLPEALHWHLCSDVSKPQKAAGSIQTQHKAEDRPQETSLNLRVGSTGRRPRGSIPSRTVLRMVLGPGGQSLGRPRQRAAGFAPSRSLCQFPPFCSSGSPPT